MIFFSTRFLIELMENTISTVKNTLQQIQILDKEKKEQEKKII